MENHTKDSRTGLRATSVYSLGLIGLRKDVPIVLGAMHDPSSAVRLAALDGIGRYEDAGTLGAAVERRAEGLAQGALAGDTDMYVRGRAALTLAAFAASPQAGDAAAALQAAAASGPRYVRERAWWSIFRQYATRVPRAFLRGGLGDADEVIRIQAVRAYGRLSDASAARDLQPLLGDPSWRVQEQAAESIRLLRGGTITEHLTQISPNVHVPQPAPDPFAALPALPRSTPMTVVRAIDPRNAKEMVSPTYGRHPRFRFVTSEGNFYVVLYPEWAPGTSANFKKLIDRGFYDNNRWFRIVPDFVVQTGEQDDKKAPGPGYTIDAEQNPLEQSSYILSMGLDYAGKKAKINSAGSEYYITLSPQYHLDGAFTVFGAVSSGFDVLGRLTEHDRVIRIERVADLMLP